VSAELCHSSVNLGLCCGQIGLRNHQLGFCQIDLYTVWLLVELHEHIALVHAIVVVHQHMHDLTGHPRRHKSHVSVHISVVCGHCPESGDNFRSYRPQWLLNVWVGLLSLAQYSDVASAPVRSWLSLPRACLAHGMIPDSVVAASEKDRDSSRGSHARE